MAKQKRVELKLTEAQRAEIKAATGKDAEKVEVELAVEELEERIAPDDQRRHNRQWLNRNMQC